jgi:signal transduction histidine kinase
MTSVDVVTGIPPNTDSVRRYVVALVLLFVFTSLLISLTEDTLRRNARRMDRIIENQQTRLQLSQIIERELFMLEVNLYRLAALGDGLDLKVMRGEFDTALNKVKAILGVLQKGGHFEDVRPTNFDNTHQVSEIFDYKGPKGGDVTATIEITPKLIEIEMERDRILAQIASQLAEGGDLNQPLVGDETLAGLRYLQPTLLRTRESVNEIHNEAVAAIAVQKRAQKAAARRYASIRFCVTGGIGLLGIFICVHTLMRIGEILTQHHRAQLARAEVHTNLERVLDALPVGVTLIDSQRRVRAINPAGLALLGLTAAESILGQDCNAILCQDAATPCVQDQAPEEGPQLATCLRRNSGEALSVIKKAIPLKMQAETVYLEAFMDISDRIQVEQALREQEHFTKTIFDFAPVGIVVIDAATHRIIDINSAALELFETDRGHAVGALCHNFICPNEVGRCPITDLGKPVDRAERKLVSHKGRQRQILKSVVSTTLGGRSCLVESFVDISPLVAERHRAEAANQAKSDFLANMSHELRTPLNHIIGFTELVVDQNIGQLNEMQAEYLNDVLVSGRQLLSLINDILDLSKVEAGKLELHPNAFDFGEILTNSLVLIKEKALKHGIQLNLTTPPYAIEMLADERMIKQIVYNLLANALKFTPDGGEIELTTLVSERSPQSGAEMGAEFGFDPPGEATSWVSLCVRDTGIGLEVADIERIFNPFEQVDQTTERRFDGTGLGLSLTRQLVTLHGGRIWAESDGLNQGSRFYVSLPKQVEFVN